MRQNSQATLAKRTSVTASAGFGTNPGTDKMVGKPGVSALLTNGAPANVGARTGMPARSSAKLHSGTDSARQTVLTSNANGQGLWMHQTSQSKIDRDQLPPIS
mgnify:CR=1 FL=1